MLAEQSAGNARGGLAFRLAFLCDTGDVAAHCVVSAALLHSHCGIGLHVSHVWLHAMETSGMAVAVAGTAAAIAGELLSRPPCSRAAAAAVAAAETPPPLEALRGTSVDNEYK